MLLTTELPFPATDNNYVKLEQWLLNVYKFGFLNTCNDQLLHMMEGPPLCLMITMNAEPVAFHTYIYVPLQWKEDVKEACLGFIEPALIRDPANWCRCMVAYSQKNDKS